MSSCDEIKIALKNKFTDYYNKFDKDESAIKRKYYHSIRVMDYCMLLAKNNNFNEHDISLAMVIGLLHDYARFEQWTKYKTYDDLKSIDHGDLGVSKLFDNNEINNFWKEKCDYDEIYDAIKYHNKYCIPDGLSNHNQLMSKVIRDADKIDILYLFSTYKDLIVQDNSKISDEVKKQFYNNKQIDRKSIKNCNDKIILILAFLFDFNFKYSFIKVRDNNSILNMFELIDNKELFKEYFDYINSYIDKKINE